MLPVTFPPQWSTVSAFGAASLPARSERDSVAAALVGSEHLLRTGVQVSRVDSQRVAQLFSEHGPRVYRRALRLLGNPADAEEATQEIFIRVVRGAEGFQNRSQLTTWLYQITTNYCLNLIRDSRRRQELSEEHLAPADDDVQAARSDDLAAVRALLSAADQQQAQAVVYVFLDGMSHEEAAELLGVSKRTVGNLLERFKAWAAEQTSLSHERAAVAAGRKS